MESELFKKQYQEASEIRDPLFKEREPEATLPILLCTRLIWNGMYHGTYHVYGHIHNSTKLF